nr:MAG TPA: hypothetical protein [Caudoviricetes sp.]
MTIRNFAADCPIFNDFTLPRSLPLPQLILL